MGAQFNTMKMAGTMTRDQVKEAFARVQDRDRYENGHSYSGGFGMATGISFPKETFKDRDSAEEWLVDNCQKKWEDALCVTYVADDATHWYIGAWCSS